MGGLIRRNGAEAGATLVEFALVMPLLLILIFGIIETGRLLTTFISVSTASREGARYATATGEGSVPGEPRYVDCDGIKAHALQRIIVGDFDEDDIVVVWDQGPNDPDPPVVVADCQGGTPPTTDLVQSGHRVTVTVEMSYDAIVPLISTFYEGLEISSTDSRTIFEGELSG